jgi:hypothetical protein
MCLLEIIPGARRDVAELMTALIRKIESGKITVFAVPVRAAVSRTSGETGLRCRSTSRRFGKRLHHSPLDSRTGPH